MKSAQHTVVCGTGSTFGLTSSRNFDEDYLRHLGELSTTRTLLVDTSQNYGAGDANSLLGRFFGGMKNVDYIDKLAFQAHDFVSLQKSIISSLQALRRPKVAFLCTHWSSNPSTQGEAFRALAWARNEGLAQHIGLGNPSAADIAQFQRSTDERLDFVEMEVNLAWPPPSSLLSPPFDDIPIVFGYSPLLGGKVAPSQNLRTQLSDVAESLQLSSGRTLLALIMRCFGANPITRSNERHRMTDYLSATVSDVAGLSEDDLNFFRPDDPVDLELSRLGVLDSKTGQFCQRLEHVVKRQSSNHLPIEAMAQEIMRDGLLKPLKVRVHGDTAFEVIDGRDRFWGALMAKGPSARVPCTVFDA